jgi:hypothetical protein
MGSERSALVRRGLGIAAVTWPMIVLAQQAPQTTNDPFPPLEATAGVIAVKFAEFATLPDVNNVAPRMMTFADETASKRLFISTMPGRLYTVSYDGKTVTPYLDINAPEWNVPVQSQGAERGLQSFAFHPQFAQRGSPGYGKFYTHLDTSNMTPAPDFVSPGPNRTHDTVLLEWTAKDAAAAAYDGAAPRELFRAAHPFGNHNGGQIGFNPLAKAGSGDLGLLYVGFADGGSGGDPFNQGQDMTSAFGKILRLDPLGKNSKNGRYGIPAANPFLKQPGALGEIYALGVRNPQRFSWDVKTGTMYVADIGQNIVEEISPVTAGANLGWNRWEASYAYVNRAVSLEKPRSEAGLTWPIVEYDHRDPILQTSAAITGVYVYRQTALPQLANRLIFGDIPSGEVFHVDANALPSGGHTAIRRVMFLDGTGTPKTLLQLIQEKNQAQGKKPAIRADLRMGVSQDGRVFILNKRDGIIRVIVP